MTKYDVYGRVFLITHCFKTKDWSVFHINIFIGQICLLYTKMQYMQYKHPT